MTLPTEALHDVQAALRLASELAEAGAEVRFEAGAKRARCCRATLHAADGERRALPLAVAVDPRVLRALALGDAPPG